MTVLKFLPIIKLKYVLTESIYRQHIKCSWKDDDFFFSFFFCQSVENLVGKGENAGYQHFLLFPQGFEMDC